MSSLVLSGDTSGTVALAAPAIAGLNTMTLVAGTGSLAPKVLSTAVASTSGTSIDFTNIPSWVTRVTVLFNGVSTSGTSNWLLQLGSGSVQTTSYKSASGQIYNSAGGAQNSTNGFIIGQNIAANLTYGTYVFNALDATTWIGSSSLGAGTSQTYGIVGGGTVTLSGSLDRIRLTTVNGTDTFDAGSVNIMYE